MTLNTIAEAVAVLKGNLEIEKLVEAATGSFKVIEYKSWGELFLY